MEGSPSVFRMTFRGWAEQEKRGNLIYGVDTDTDKLDSSSNSAVALVHEVLSATD